MKTKMKNNVRVELTLCVNWACIRRGRLNGFPKERHNLAGGVAPNNEASVELFGSELFVSVIGTEGVDPEQGSIDNAGEEPRRVRRMRRDVQMKVEVFLIETGGDFASIQLDSHVEKVNCGAEWSECPSQSGCFVHSVFEFLEALLIYGRTWVGDPETDAVVDEAFVEA